MTYLTGQPIVGATRYEQQSLPCSACQEYFWAELPAAQGVNSADLLPAIRAADVTVAGGLHPAIRNEYFRIGHMRPANAEDLFATLGAVEAGLWQCGYKFEFGRTSLQR
jgi:aspartate aminotransferase-like enzyme